MVIEKLEERLEIVKYLHSHGASIDTFDCNGLTPFMYACSSGNYALVKYLLDEQQSKDDGSTLRITNEHSTNGETCLMYAIESGNLDIVTLLCDYGVELNNQKSPSYITAAAFFGYKDILEKLIQLGLDIHEFGMLYFVSSKRNIKPTTTTNNILDQNDDGVVFNPIYACCHCGSVECLRLLFEAKAKIDWRTRQGNSISYLFVDFINKKDIDFLS